MAQQRQLYLGNELWLPPPPERGGGKAFMMALAMHGLLFLLLYFGIQWNRGTPPAVEAELWSALPQIEAPAPTIVAPEPPVVEKKIEPPKVEEPPAKKPDIALEQEKLRQQKIQTEKERKEKIEREKFEKLKEKIRQQDAARLGIGKKPREGGTAAQTSGPSGEWQSAVATAIKANINYSVPSDLQGNPKALFTIQLLPSGELMGAPKLVRSSGIPSYDEAVGRAILKTDLPRPKNGIFPRQLELEFDPRDK